MPIADHTVRSTIGKKG